ncbi:hypothetical protein [Butyrivibrio sp. WCE2006]|uniref:hypothetical protein n=1 Tax=Butyrivibrio sp. WCE2006 TaxID=1410611 RepID=UPI0005D1FFB5|nr:hypothetical protein [Butyrivibrio sp. WCE2006]
METKKEIVPLPEGRYMFTPFIRAVERDNPAYVHCSDIYSVVTADNAEDFIDQILNPRNEECMNINEIVDVISGV